MKVKEAETVTELANLKAAPSEPSKVDEDLDSNDERYVTPVRRLTVEVPSKPSSSIRAALRSNLKNPQRTAQKGYLVHR